MAKRKNKISKSVKRLYNAAYEFKKAYNKEHPEATIPKLEGYREALKGKKPRSMKAARKLIKDFFESEEFPGVSPKDLRRKIYQMAPKDNDYNDNPMIEKLYSWEDSHNTKYEDTLSYAEAMQLLAEFKTELGKISKKDNRKIWEATNAAMIELKQAYTIKRKGKKK